MAVFWMWSGFVMIWGGIAGLFPSYKKLSHDAQFHSLLLLLPPLCVWWTRRRRNRHSSRKSQ